MKRLVLLCGLLALTGLSAAPPPSSCTPFDVGPGGCIKQVAWRTIFDYDTLTVHRIPHVAIYVDPSLREWTALFAPFCGANRQGNKIVGFEMCVGAIVECKRRGLEDLAALYMEITPVF